MGGEQIKESTRDWTFLDGLLARWRANAIIGHIPRNAAVADLGCADGRLLFYLDKGIREGVGIDRKAGSKKGNITIMAGDLEAPLHLESDYFDVVISLAVVEHLEKPEQMLAEAYRILKRGGKLILTTPTENAKPLLEFAAFRLGIINRKEILEHKKYWARDELIRMLQGVGFCNIRHKYFQLGFNQMVIAEK